jgi:ubiquinone/menaquinone biosynthesis C-methylase UbiE
MVLNEKEQKTGELFSSLWTLYSPEEFKKTVELFEKRFTVNGFDVGYIKGKNCLDVGCGSGRYTMAMAELGAEKSIGIDIGEKGIEFAKKSCEGQENVHFEVGSILDIPFEGEKFDFVCCSGVIMHTKNPRKAVEEVFRVLKKGGYAYFLIYGAEGISWNLVMELRTVIQKLGIEFVKQLMVSEKININKQKYLLDNYIVPFIDFYTWSDISSLLKEVGFQTQNRWNKGQFDHESSFDMYIKDLVIQRELFNPENVNIDCSKEQEKLLKRSFQFCNAALKKCELIISDHKKGYISKKMAEMEIYGYGNHRVLARK